MVIGYWLSVIGTPSTGMLTAHHRPCVGGGMIGNQTPCPPTHTSPPPTLCRWRHDWKPGPVPPTHPSPPPTLCRWGHDWKPDPVPTHTPQPTTDPVSVGAIWGMEVKSGFQSFIHRRRVGGGITGNHIPRVIYPSPPPTLCRWRHDWKPDPVLTTYPSPPPTLCRWRHDWKPDIVPPHTHQPTTDPVSVEA